MSTSRQTYVISDLHIGGRYGETENDRGFRMCTKIDALVDFVQHIIQAPRPDNTELELVINGDFIDFLAEEDSPPGASERFWKPCIHSPDEAVRKLGDIVRRDKPFFDALSHLLAQGHRLTVLLGNHDVELSYPLVADTLRGHLGVTLASAFSFLYEGQGYRVGDAWIEHGNHYDGFNRIDHQALRHVRIMQTRGEDTSEGPFQPPPGSRLVAYVMNPIKAQYPFIDLLKPETEAVLPILIALVPGLRWKIPQVLLLSLEASFASDISARDESDSKWGQDTSPQTYGQDVLPAPIDEGQADSEQEILQELIASRMTEVGAHNFLQQLAAIDPPPPPASEEEEAIGADIAAPSPHILRLLLPVDRRRLLDRLPALLASLRVVQNDRSFEESEETERRYVEAAQTLANTGYRYVIFGHTHLAKRVPLAGGATYLNTGTWADLIKFPKTLLAGSNTQAQAELASFLLDLESGQLARYLHFAPTYVRLDVHEDHVQKAELLTWIS